MKKLSSVLIIAVLLMLCVALLPTKAEAATVASGTCGSNVTWNLDSDGVLTISGSGNMYGYDYDTVPWKSHRRSIKKIQIENGVTSIGNYAFYGCDKAESVSIPNTVKMLGKSCFSHCSSLRGIDIPYGVKMIPAFAFDTCSNAEYINVPSTVTTFSQSCFQDCSSITSFIIPEGTTTIPTGMLWQCTSLQQVQIPKTVTLIEGLAFQDCGNLSDVYFTGTKAQYNAIDIRFLNEHNQGLRNVTIHYSSKAPCINHAYGSYVKANDLQHSRTCANCNYVETVTHTWNSGTITKPATCKETGTKALTCTSCNATKTETIAKLTTHTYGGWTKENNSVHKHICSVCSKEETANHTWNSGSVTKAATCKEAGVKTFTCTTCSGTKTESIAQLTTHTYGGWTKESDSIHKHICSVCSKEETANHTWNSGAITKVATCKEAGIKTFTCTTCSGTKAETITKLTTHTYDHACDTACNVCGLTRTITHSYKTEWSKDKTNHWHECSVCKEKKASAAHTPGAAATETTAQTCTTCGYIITPALGHKHSYATTWTTDDDGHWHKCSGCEEKDSYAKHSFENACDKDCSICGYTRETKHNYVTEWKSDKTNHWHACTNCGHKAEEAAHEPGAVATETTAQTCTICSYEVAPALGVKETEPATTPVEPEDSSDSTVPVKPTEPVGDKNDTESNNTVLILLLGIVLGGGGAAAAVMIMKKKSN